MNSAARNARTLGVDLSFGSIWRAADEVSVAFVVIRLFAMRPKRCSPKQPGARLRRERDR
jgi:hypothetical protein